MRLSIALIASGLVASGAAFAQLPLEAMPVRVGGYVVDDQAQPVAAAVVRFIDQATMAEYEGVTDAIGWYGNVAFADVPVLGSSGALGQNYPNPFAGKTTVEIAGDAVKSAAASRDLLIYDLRGRLVGTVPAVAGTHDVATRGAGALPEGAYFYRLGDQTRRMVGTPRRVTIRIGASEAAGVKAVTAWRRVITAAGFELSDVLVGLDDGRINFASTGLTPVVAQPRPLSIKVFNISGTEQLLDGTVTLARGAWSETQAASVDSIYRFTIPAEVDTVAFAISGFTGHDHAEQIFSVLRPDSLAVRGWLADDERGAAVADLPGMVFLEAVPEIRLDDWRFMESAGLSVHWVRHRLEDVRFVLYTNSRESDFSVPAHPGVLDLLRQARDEYMEILDGGIVDGLRLIGYSSTESSAAPYPWVVEDMQGRHDIYQYTGVPPGNGRSDFMADGDIDFATSFIGIGHGWGTAREEIANPTELYDNGCCVTGIEDDLWYRDIVHTVMKSRIWRGLR